MTSPTSARRRSTEEAAQGAPSSVATCAPPFGLSIVEELLAHGRHVVDVGRKSHVAVLCVAALAAAATPSAAATTSSAAAPLLQLLLKRSEGQILLSPALPLRGDGVRCSLVAFGRALLAWGFRRNLDLLVGIEVRVETKGTREVCRWYSRHSLFVFRDSAECRDGGDLARRASGLTAEILIGKNRGRQRTLEFVAFGV